MKLHLTVFVLLLTASFPMAIAQEKPNGNTLLRQCGAAIRRTEALDAGHDVGYSSEQQDAEFCLGYINGFVDQDERLCPPDGVTMKQYIRIVVKFLNDHPEKLHLGRARLVEEALGSAFPCPK